MSDRELTAGERRVLGEAPSGELVDLSVLSDDERVVSPDIIRRLCVGSEATSVDPRGIRVKGARLLKLLDLSFCTVPHPLRFTTMTFATTPDLSQAHLPALSIDDCSLPGLLAEGITLAHDLHLISSEVRGEVRLIGAKIGGEFDCSGATLSNRGGAALFADRAEIGGSVFLGDGFTATGAVRLLGTKIGGQLAFFGATLTNEYDDALTADGAEIGRDVYLRDGFSATGAVSLSSAKIGGQLGCVNATFTHGTGFALRARDAAIGGALVFRDVRVTGGVDLFRASATTLDDDLGSGESALGSWRGVSPLVLEGFAYVRFEHHAEWSSKLRQRWLKQTVDFQQGAWQQLIAVYRSQGRDDEATRAAIALQNDRLRRSGLSWYRRAGRRALWAVVGHGYRPWLAGIWAAAIVAAFAAVVANWSGMFVPESQDVRPPQPLAYAADTFLPIVDLGQANEWMPTGWVRWVEWSVILLGWGLSTIFVAGFTRIVRNE